MGSNKALLPVPGTAGLTFVEHLASLLAERCAEVLLVARDDASGGEFRSRPACHNWRLVYDRVPDYGPLMGLYSGLLATSFSHALVLAVDLPFARPSLLSWLCAFPLTDDILMPRVQGVPQVLLARYPRAILPKLEECVRSGRRDPRALLTMTRAAVNFLEEEQLRALDPDLRSFVNVNTPEDLAQSLSLF